MKLIIIVSTIFLICLTVNAQNKPVWNNKKCAVSLTYDDALNIHLDKVIPSLDSLGLKGTFYLSCYSPGFRNRINEWRIAASHGHELGNHTLFHPCEGNREGREWVSPDYDLSKYSVQRMVDEIRITNSLLEAVDGKTQRTFAYTCGDTMAGNSSYLDKIKNDFISARGIKAEMLDINNVDLFNIGSYVIDGQSGEELIELVRKAMENNKFIVFLFHGVGGEHSINVDLGAHNQLLHFLKENEKSIWVAPFIEVSEYIKGHSNK